MGGAGKVVVWHTDSWEEFVSFEPKIGWFHDFCFAPDSKTIASAGGDAANKEHVIKVWDVSGQKELKTLKGHDQPVTAVTFGPDANTLISVSMDRTIRIWDVKEGKETKKLGPTSDDITRERKVSRRCWRQSPWRRCSSHAARLRRACSSRTAG